MSINGETCKHLLKKLPIIKLKKLTNIQSLRTDKEWSVVGMSQCKSEFRTVNKQC